MPIKFRCPHCQQFLGISRSKAGIVTDCPTCGRTIRVPTIEGKIVPLPGPKIDLKDSELRDALGTLAKLESMERGGNESVAGVGSDIGPRPSPEVIDSPELRPLAVATPIKQAEEVVDVPEIDPQAAFEELSRLSEAQPPPNHSLFRKRHRNKSSKNVPIWVLGASVICLVCGFVLGRLSVPRITTESISENAPNLPEVADEHPIENSDPEFKVALNANPPRETINRLMGTLTFVGKTGEPRPDKGARVLVLPFDRAGTAMLPGEGFCQGADPIDQEILQAAVNTLGGGFAIADDQGDFEITLEDGKYGVILVSRYQSRTEGVSIRSDASDFLERYFKRPEKLVGQVQMEFETITTTDEVDIELDFEFPPG